MNCSQDRGCNCFPGDPEIATPQYSLKRRHPDAGDLDALRRVTGWIRAGEAQCHIRFSDGEFMSMLGVRGRNCDGQDLLPQSLGKKLIDALFFIYTDAPDHILVGGDWRRPELTYDWLEKNDLLTALPWCPSQVFVNGILSGDSMDWLVALREAPGKKYLVANDRIAAVAPSLDATSLLIPSMNAFEVMGGIEERLRKVLRPGDIVLYAGGLGCKPTVYKLFRELSGTTHLDVGCFFDGAAGLVSRSWLGGTPDAQLLKYRAEIIPWLLRAN